MFQFTDKNGRVIEITATFSDNNLSSESAEEIVIDILNKAPETEYIELPA